MDDPAVRGIERPAIFLSSPRDCADDRLIVERVLRETTFNRFDTYRYEADSDAVFDAGAGYQQRVADVSDPRFLATICLLGERIGSFVGDDAAGTRHIAQIARELNIPVVPREAGPGEITLSGTVYELLTSLHAQKANRDRIVLLFVRGPPTVLPHVGRSLTPLSRRGFGNGMHYRQQASTLQDEALAQFQKAHEAQLDQIALLLDALHTKGRAIFHYETEAELQFLARRVGAWLMRRSRPSDHEKLFPGLGYFDVEAGGALVGRDKLAFDVLNYLRAPPSGRRPFVLLRGPSGVGKSSLARAGVAYAAMGYLGPEQPGYAVVVCNPEDLRQGHEGALPHDVLKAAILKALASSPPLCQVAPGSPPATGTGETGERAAEAIRSMLGDRRLLVVLDQAEGLLLSAREQSGRYEKRQTYWRETLAMLDTLSSDPDHRVGILLTLQQDEDFASDALAGLKDLIAGCGLATDQAWDVRVVPGLTDTTVLENIILAPLQSVTRGVPQRARRLLREMLADELEGFGAQGGPVLPLVATIARRLWIALRRIEAQQFDLPAQDSALTPIDEGLFNEAELAAGELETEGAWERDVISAFEALRPLTGAIDQLAEEAVSEVGAAFPNIEMQAVADFLLGQLVVELDDEEDASGAWITRPVGLDRKLGSRKSPVGALARALLVRRLLKQAGLRSVALSHRSAHQRWVRAETWRKARLRWRRLQRNPARLAEGDREALIQLSLREARSLAVGGPEADGEKGKRLADLLGGELERLASQERRIDLIQSVVTTGHGPIASALIRKAEPELIAAHVSIRAAILSQMLDMGLLSQFEELLERGWTIAAPDQKSANRNRRNILHNLAGAAGASPAFLRRVLDPLEPRLRLAFASARDPATGWTPLHVAAALGSAAILPALASEVAANDDLHRFLLRSPRELPPERHPARLAETPSPLFLAASRGHASAVKALLGLGGTNPPVNEVDPASGETPVTAAALGGHDDIVTLLLDGAGPARARWDLLNRYGYSVIHALAKRNAVTSLKHVRRLLEERGKKKNAGLAKLNASGLLTPLHVAAQSGAVEALEFLIEWFGLSPIPPLGDSLGRTPLHYAVIGDSAATARALLGRGADPSARDQYGVTPLLYAVRLGRADVADVLLQRGAEVDCSDEAGRSALVLAALAGNVEIASLLLAHGADAEWGGRPPEASDSSDATPRMSPLYYAAVSGMAEMVTLLLSRGASPLRAEAGRMTPLHLAAARNDVPTTKVLLRPETLAFVNSHGRTPVHSAARTGAAETLALMLKHPGANLIALNDEGQTPLHLAAFFGHARSAKLLLDRLSDEHVDLRDKADRTPLWSAVAGGSSEVARMLLERGADPNTIGFGGQPALHRALMIGRTDLADLLLSHGADVETLDGGLGTIAHAACAGPEADCLAWVLGRHPRPEQVLFGLNAAGRSPLEVMIYRERQERRQSRAQPDDRDDAEEDAAEAKHDLNFSAATGFAAVLREHRALLQGARPSQLARLLAPAALAGHPDLIEELLALGADQEVLDRYGLSALHLAARGGNPQAVHLLLAAGVGLGARGGDGSTVLHHALISGSVEVASMILDEGERQGLAIWSMIDGYDQSPLHTAVHHKMDDMLGRLVALGVPVDLANIDGESALHYAAFSGSEKACEILIGAGASLELKDRRGQTPLLTALRARQFKAALRLARAGADPGQRDEMKFDARGLIGHWELHAGITGQSDAELNDRIARLDALPPTVLSDVRSAGSLEGLWRVPRGPWPAIQAVKAAITSPKPGAVEIARQMIDRDVKARAGANQLSAPSVLHELAGIRARSPDIFARARALLMELIDHPGLASANSWGQAPIHAAAMAAVNEAKEGDRNEGANAEYRFEPTAAMVSLLRKPSSETLQDALGRTYTHYAAAAGNTEVLAADPHAPEGPDRLGLTPLHLACLHGEADAVAALLRIGVWDSIDRKCTIGATPLHLAVARAEEGLSQSFDPSVWPWIRCAAILLANGASAAIPDQAGKTASQIAGPAAWNEITRLCEEMKGPGLRRDGSSNERG
jgi:ankyrin repeat protein